MTLFASLSVDVLSTCESGGVCLLSWVVVLASCHSHNDAQEQQLNALLSILSFLAYIHKHTLQHTFH
jgi:hypothetical protein